jgi:glycosyltransferase 2 family protein
VTPGKLGEVVKSYTLKNVNGTPILKSAPVILAERLTDFIGLILLIVAGAYGFGFARGAIVAFALFFAAVTILLGWRRGSEWLIRLFDRIPVLRRFTGHALSAYESIYALLRPATLAAAVVLSVIAWFFECLGYWIVLDVFRAPATMLQAMFMYSFSTIIGAVSMLPGGLGSTETSLTGLAQLVHVGKSVAVASTFIIRAATLWFAVIVGIAVTFLFQKRISIPIAELPLDTPEAESREVERRDADR